MIKHLITLAHFLQGTYAKFGTSANLFREITVSVITAVTIAVLVGLLTPKEESPAAELNTTLTTVLTAQRKADSTVAAVRIWKLQGRIDSLNNVLLERDEQDSLRENAGLSDLDAMQLINGAINADRNRSGK
ncbi:hypothetical protein [Spirosoma oryzicola]|uniref:hypothetical protein n=1 Tax=Spirosoma oryzicola TaxID=2898794 RepID=UPI001E647621|nr:hypothetical protein [Spirosoma oryzicola]UHG93401.1 hypothetical protein LQ777_10960 [Spirosoma oryzicola]